MSKRRKVLIVELSRVRHCPTCGAELKIWEFGGYRMLCCSECGEDFESAMVRYGYRVFPNRDPKKVRIVPVRK